jgi:ABC-2 type transport system permease protein
MWIVGMAPMGLRRVIIVKYWLATFSSLVLTLGLITLSNYLLGLAWDRLLFFSAAITAMTLALNGLSMGLGVLYPNLREPQPAKIVSGFGGTLCLVLSFLYILTSVLALGFGTTGLHPHPGLVVASVGFFALLSMMIGWLPLKLAFHRLKNFEF